MKQDLPVKINLCRQISKKIYDSQTYASHIPHVRQQITSELEEQNS